MKFFFDENVGLYIVRGLRGFDEDIMHILERFAKGTPDEEWMEYVGDKGMIWISQDRFIRNRPVIRRLMQQHKIGGFFLLGKELDHWQRIEQVIGAWPRIRELSANTAPPFAFTVRQAGSVANRINIP